MSDIEVRIKNIGRVDDEKGSLASAEVTFLDEGDGLPRFMVTALIGADCPDGTKIQELERALLSRAAEILSKLAQLSSEELFRMLKEQRQADFRPASRDA